MTKEQIESRRSRFVSDGSDSRHLPPETFLRPPGELEALQAKLKAVLEFLPDK